MVPRPQLQRVRIVEGAVPEVRALLSDETRLAAIAEAHRAVGIWVEHVFLEEWHGRWYFWSYTESDDPEAYHERLSAIDTPEFAEIRERFRSWFDEVVTTEYQTTVSSPPQ